MVALSLHLVLAQRLVRTLCGHCAEPHQPDAQEHEWLRMALGPGPEADEQMAATRWRKPRGCNECNHTGYSGRSGVYEFIEMTQELVEAMNDNDPARFTQAGRRQMAGHTLRRDALRLAAEGRTSIDEAMRVGSQLDE
jgi:MSHA biogenesis protein MshE